MNLPNRLTILRVCLVPLILLFMLPLTAWPIFDAWNSFISGWGQLVAFVLFGLASLTDLYDGKIARERNLVTNFGKFLDPIADKMLVVSVLIAFVQINRISALVPIIVIIREFIVTGIRLLASDKGVVIAASNLGKAKTVSQIVAILIMLLEKVLQWLTAGFLNPVWINMLGDAAMTVAVILTLVSGFDYLKKNISYLSQ
ncbi:MAG TPA: CDP-diacylglycerol--glycerol-3-phosphate 3-phosphatidyltransferase [Clostridiales bacterium]|nr:CDP-diacylglycerol--glycerol-3-phosphate 3-phosphatidyltransferase [Clostridiales bacterium]